MLEGGEESGADLEKAAHSAHELAVKLRAEGKDAEADEVEKLAQLLDVAVESKLEVEAGQKEKESKEGMKEAAAEGHAVADQLREEGNGELADMVDNVVEEVEHALSGELDAEELEHAVSDAKAAAEKLRAEGKEEEAAKMEAMVVKLEGAQQAHEEAAELMKAEGEAAEQAAEAAKAAGECAEALEKAGLGEEAKSVKDWQGMLEGGEESGADLEKAAHSAHELAAKLRAEGKDAEADEVEKLAQLLDVAAEPKLEVEAGQKEKASKEGMKEAAAEGHAVADKLRE